MSDSRSSTNKINPRRALFTLLTQFQNNDAFKKVHDVQQLLSRLISLTQDSTLSHDMWISDVKLTLEHWHERLNTLPGGPELTASIHTILADAKTQKIEKLTRNTTSILLERHFADHTPAKDSDFQFKSSKTKGKSHGYLGEHQPYQHISMIKKSDRSIDLITNINELVMGSYFRRLLYNRTPLINLLENTETPSKFLIRSKYLDNAESYDEFTGSHPNHPVITGGEKVYAAVLMAADADAHDGNLVVIAMENEEKGNPSHYIFGKIDQGFAGTNFFSDSSFMFAYLHSLSTHINHNIILVDAYQLIEALESMLNVSDDERVVLITHSIEQLKKTGLDIHTCKFSYSLDGKKKEIIFDDYPSLQNHYLIYLNQQAKVARTLAKQLQMLLWIDRADKQAWLRGGKWLLDMKGEDPLTWINMHGYTIQNQSPLIIRAQGENYSRPKNENELLEIILTASVPPSEALIQNYDIEEKNSQGETPLLVAARCGNLPWVNFLLDYGVSLTPKNSAGRDVVQLLVNTEIRDWPTIQKLIDKDADFSQVDIPSLLIACLNEKKNSVANFLLNKELFVLTNDTIHKAIFNAAESGDREAMQAVLIVGAHLDQKEVITRELQSLIEKIKAAEILSPSRGMLINIVANFIELGADCTSINSDSIPFLIQVVKFNITQLIPSLIEAKIDLNAKDLEGNNALHIAADKHLHKVIEKLIEHIDPNVQNAKGLTAGDILIKRPGIFGEAKDTENSISLLLTHGWKPPAAEDLKNAFLAYVANRPKLYEYAKPEVDERKDSLRKNSK